MADVADSFYNTIVPCSSQASYLCQAWTPPCPEGYTWVPNAGNASCFRLRTGGYYQSSSYWNSITTADKICAEDGTRLTSPDNPLPDNMAIVEWLKMFSIREFTGDSSVSQLWFGFRKISQKLTGLQSPQVISPWYTRSQYTPPMLSFVTLTQSNSLYPNECVTFKPNNPVIGYKCLNSDPSNIRALCEYRHCTTTTGKYCIFPFNIGARQYDTCVPFGGDAWCATSVDSSGNLLTKETCSSTCPVSSCPVGFTALVYTCIQISAVFPNDTVHSVQEASDLCMGMGARLYQPRSLISLRTLLYMNQPLFNLNDSTPGLLAYDISGNLLALGIYGSQSYGFTYGDGSRFHDDIIVPQTEHGFDWGPNMPDENSDHGCVTLTNKQQLANSRCDGYPDGLSPGLKMSYICEARPFATVDGPSPNKSCVFPFKLSATDNWHVSCIYGTNTKVCKSCG